ncbi:arylamine N-acetyltransferase [Hymenobacter gummosus]|uniref:Arylamine N-acetyltransferase n=1 Tax=Hymenobacter gummosus TaxID=1776032 RepID=A0A431TTX6_9BACT|nr:arylamine N-acetyltransferase [Hymenobacter gummosus]RTQ44733.1 arylamine N-acetyltransferase [Hymenobacter gummosus]
MIILTEYLERIGLPAPPSGASEAALRAVHAAHAGSIPFENLDIHLGRPISNDLDVIFDKLVRRRRGGYCFEQNALLAAALTELGFRTKLVLGRVTFGAKVPRPRGHLAVLAELDGRRWLADVGFGGYGLIEPVPFVPGVPQAAGGEVYRLDEAATGGWELLMQTGEGWKSLYWFDESPCYPVDISILNFYHAHCAESVFNQNRIVALPTRAERRLLTNEEFKVIRQGVATTHRVADEDEYRRLLRQQFGIGLSAAEQLRPRLVLAE